MRPRFVLMLFGFITALLALLALVKNSIPMSIVGSAIGEKISSVPASPTLYFSLFLIMGVVAVIISFMERKIVY
jgi:predicted alpha/beta hydrolase